MVEKMLKQVTLELLRIYLFAEIPVTLGLAILWAYHYNNILINLILAFFIVLVLIPTVYWYVKKSDQNKERESEKDSIMLLKEAFEKEDILEVFLIQTSELNSELNDFLYSKKAYKFYAELGNDGIHILLQLQDGTQYSDFRIYKRAIDFSRDFQI